MILKIVYKVETLHILSLLLRMRYPVCVRLLCLSLVSEPFAKFLCDVRKNSSVENIDVSIASKLEEPRMYWRMDGDERPQTIWNRENPVRHEQIKAFQNFKSS